ncbi:hypothetical protein FRC03_011393 [Tulasnella sp. 419]|nr:hypothetical protein FRC03_011393 [Tulasnella sp. 419]
MQAGLGALMGCYFIYARVWEPYTLFMCYRDWPRLTKGFFSMLEDHGRSGTPLLANCTKEKKKVGKGRMTGMLHRATVVEGRIIVPNKLPKIEAEIGHYSSTQEPRETAFVIPIPSSPSAALDCLYQTCPTRVSPNMLHLLKALLDKGEHEEAKPSGWLCPLVDWIHLPRKQRCEIAMHDGLGERIFSGLLR